LSGAKFKLSTTTDETDALPLATIDTNQYQYQTGTGEATEITTDDTGAFSIEGLDAGTYYLIETDAPTGYNKLNAPITVTIAEDGSVTFTAGNESDTATGNDITVTVVNQTGAELPSTGGIGTTIFYILGSALVIGCGIVLISRKRMNSK
jgi:LPXTG-motif cell wall-anchored protein